MNVTRDRASVARSGWACAKPFPGAVRPLCGAAARLIFVVLFFLIGCGDGREPTTPPTPPSIPPSPLQRGVDYLLSKQSPDGGWHSETYGQLKGGAANTSLIVYALAHLPADQRKPIQPQIDRAIAFLLKGLDEQGFIRHVDGSADYPTYATAMLVTALHRMEMAAAHKPAIKRKVDYLKQSQQTTRQGWTEKDPDYGGWNQTGGEAEGAKIEGQTNIAITSIALEALKAAGALEDEAEAMARIYAARCWNNPGHGGFFFTSRPDHFLNKAGSYKQGDATLARSYGTATADGITALLATGLVAEMKMLSPAFAWLAARPGLDAVPFEPADLPEDQADFTQGLRFYYAFALGRVIRAAPSRLPGWGDALTADLVKRQQPDGSWRNANTMMREDDPLIATAMAVAAMAMTR
jgi:hypothetical protein